MPDLDLEPEREPRPTLEPPPCAPPPPARSLREVAFGIFHPVHALVGALLLGATAWAWGFIRADPTELRTILSAAAWGAAGAGVLQDRLWGFLGWSTRKFWDRRLYDLE